MLKRVIFDLETSGLGRSCDILQMAVVDLTSGKNWRQYMKATQQIQPGASNVNKLTIVNDKLCYNGTECKDVVSPATGIKKFCTYLMKNYPDGVTLVAHNGHNFDFPLLKRDLEKFKCVLNNNYSIQCMDSIEIFRRHFPRLGRYNQPFLVDRFIGSENVSDAHEALGDCVNLKNAIEMAAKEKQMTISDFMGNVTHSLISTQENER